MTIFHCINSLGVGGAEVLLKDTVEGLREHQHVICFLRNPDTLVPQLKDHILYDLQHTSWKQSFSTCKKLKQLICRHQPDVVHAHLFESSLLARIATPKKYKFFFTIHNILSKDAFEMNYLSLIAEKLTYHKRHRIIAVSQEALDDYDKWVGIKGKTDVLYNYVSQAFFDLNYNYSQQVTGAFKLVAVGNLRRQKNYLALLEAFQLLKDIPVSLDIFGEGDLKEELQKYIDENGLNIRLMGRVKHVSQVLPDYHAYIMLSWILCMKRVFTM
jgi:glycosyltransferase involved in cell wall biosynthesis